MSKFKILLVSLLTTLAACRLPPSELPTRDGNYVTLVEIYPEVGALYHKATGNSGKYGHVELIINNRVFGCRPPQCSEISLPELKQKFAGHNYRIREVKTDGDSNKAIAWFKQNLEGKAYDFFNRNCTDAAAGMYAASGDTKIRVLPLDVKKTYAGSEDLQDFMFEHNMSLPKRDYVFFPDQFDNSDVGEIVSEGRF